MSELPEQQQKVVDEAHAYRDAYNIREERREIYMMVAKDNLKAVYDGRILESGKAITYPNEGALRVISEIAEAIYQGMLRFCDENKKTND